MGRCFLRKPLQETSMMKSPVVMCSKCDKPPPPSVNGPFSCLEQCCYLLLEIADKTGVRDDKSVKLKTNDRRVSNLIEFRKMNFKDKCIDAHRS